LLQALPRQHCHCFRSASSLFSFGIFARLRVDSNIDVFSLSMVWRSMDNKIRSNFSEVGPSFLERPA
jgi:hypothetical protein